MNSIFKVFSFIFILAIISSCHKEPSHSPVYTDQGTIGIQGGTVKTSDGASIEIPEGALNTNQTISITNTTKEDAVINNGGIIYKLKPDGLIFSDSITITVPFDDTFIDLNCQQDNYGVGIMVFQDTTWIKLKMEINLVNKTLTAKTIHFSTYVVYYPSSWSDYFKKNKDKTVNKLIVPYYNQGDLPWCSYYSLSMVTKYAGYYYKAPYFASLLNESPASGMRGYELEVLDNLLENLGMKAELAFPAWGNVNNLCGYVLNQINNGFPVWIGSRTLQHAFVVSGHDQTGFYVNDPSGAFLKVALNSQPSDLSMIHITYDQFIDALLNLWDFLTPNQINLYGAESTYVIKSISSCSNNGLSINFPVGTGGFFVYSKDKEFVGKLKIDGAYSPNGYSLVNILNNNNSFDGSDYMLITPIISNSDEIQKSTNLHFKIDNKDVSGSPVRVDDIPADKTYGKITDIYFQLNNLQKGNHYLSIEIRSEDSKIIYDYWNVIFKIDKEFFYNPGTVTDVEGNTYKTNQIGSQIWMTENLKVTKFNDRSLIPLITDGLEWISLSTPGYCWYENKEVTYKNIYGALYNWFAVNTSKLCPSGWHVPKDFEWTQLEMLMGINNSEALSYNWRGRETNTGGKLKEAGTLHWVNPNTGATNLSGFTALPGGYRYDGSAGFFTDVEKTGIYWTSTEYPSRPIASYIRIMEFDSCSIFRGAYHKTAGYSVRCLKDN